MTKKEIRDEAERIVYGMGYDTLEADGHSDFAVEDILIKTLEPKEKRIEKLEKENAELQNQYKTEKEKWYSEYTAMYDDFQKQIEELEKENVKLKEQHRVNLIQMQATLNRKSIQNTKLIKAKELLRDIYDIDCEGWNIRCRIDEFLKEVE